MKKRLYLFVCLLMSVSFLNAQVEKEVVIGSTIDGKELKARGFEFGGKIREYNMDTTSNSFLIKLGYLTKNERYYQNKGNILVFNCREKKELWRRKLDFRVDQAALLSDGVLFNSKGVKSLYLDLQTGQEKWNKKMLPYILDHHNNKLWAYKNAVSKKLECYDTASGTLLWTREIPHTYGWNHHELINDSTRLIVSDGIHLVNINDGTGKSYPMETGTTNYTEAVALGALGVLTGALTGVAMFPTGGNAVMELTSNVLREDSLVYFASRTQLLCMDEQMNVKWGYPLPDKLTSHSILFTSDDRIYMINYGCGYRGNFRDFSSSYERKMMEVNIGRPFIACLDKNTGKNIYLNQLTKKKDRIEDACLKRERNTLYLMFDDGISFCQLTDSSEIEVSPWSEEINGKLQGFLFRSFYLTNTDSASFHRIMPLDSSSCFVYNDQYDVFEVDEQMNVIQKYPREEIYFASINLDGYSIVSRDENQYLIDFTGKKLARLHLPYDLFFAEDKIYTLDRERDNLLEIDVKELFPEREIDYPII